jgi:6-phospho-beta-glucosidase
VKVAVIGGGSSYTPELVNGFLERVGSFPLTELWLMDISQERLDIVGKFAQRMVEAAGSPFTVHLTTSQRDAVKDALYVTTQLRVGGMDSRRDDEYLGLKYDLIGQETTGVGGMAKALRTIPVILSIARDMEELAPGATLVNFTNPAGLVTEALARYAPNVPSAGVCNVAVNTSMKILQSLQLDAESIAPERVQLDTLGLNHLTWHRGFTIDGENVWSQVMESYIKQLHEDGDKAAWDIPTIESLQMIPNYYLAYFYYTNKKIQEQAKWPPSRAEQVMEIEADLLKQYAEPDRTQPPEDLMKRGGAYYSTVATQLLNAHYNDLNEVHVVNVPHRGAVDGYPEDWVLEMPCMVNRSGIEPIKTDPLPMSCFGLVAQVKSYEILTVEAAVHGDKDAVYQALLTNPLGPSADQVEAVLNDMLGINQKYLPQF